MCGTPEYVAPEILFPVPQSSQSQDGYGVEVDMWSAGVLLYILLSGKLAFQQPNKKRLYDSIRAGQFSFTPLDRWKNVSLEAQDLIRKLIEVNPRKRYTVKQALKHPWIVDEDIQEELRRTLSQGGLSFNVLDYEELEGISSEGGTPAQSPQPAEEVCSNLMNSPLGKRGREFLSSSPSPTGLKKHKSDQ
jgi:serine/threonine protein kinase